MSLTASSVYINRTSVKWVLLELFSADETHWLVHEKATLPRIGQRHGAHLASSCFVTEYLKKSDTNPSTHALH
jgi:hypothetical protein